MTKKKRRSGTMIFCFPPPSPVSCFSSRVSDHFPFFWKRTGPSFFFLSLEHWQFIGQQWGLWTIMTNIYEFMIWRLYDTILLLARERRREFWQDACHVQPERPLTGISVSYFGIFFQNNVPGSCVQSSISFEFIKLFSFLEKFQDRSLIFRNCLFTF